MTQPRLVAALAAIAVFIAGLSLTLQFTVDTNDDGQGHQQKTYSFRVNDTRGDGQPAKTVAVPKTLVTATASGLETNLRDETPTLAEQVAPGELTAAQEAAARIKATTEPLPTAGATAEVPGCVTRFVSNQSSRHGVRPSQFWLHYTVSHNVPGWADVNAVVALFDRPSSGVSANFVIDAEGHCAYIVPIEAKAWTQAAANPFAISFEIIAYGNETTYMQPAGYAKLRSILRVLSKRTGIPLQRGAVSGCVPTRAGIVAHSDGGICAGGHHDIQPFSIDAVSRYLSIAQPRSKLTVWLAHRKAITVTYRKKCLHRYQRRVRPVTCAKLRIRARKLDSLIRTHSATA